MPGLSAPLRGVATLLLIVTNTLVHGLPVIAIALVKLVLPRGARPAVGRVLTALAEDWIAFNTLLLRRQHRMRWEVRGLAGLDIHGWYLVIANHRSWVDILALQAVLNRRVPL